MDGYRQRPWLALYENGPADIAIEYDDLLAMWRPAWPAPVTGH